MQEPTGKASLRTSLVTPFVLATPDGVALHVYHAEPEGRPRGAVQIVHGLGEHAGRYVRLAADLQKAGYAVYAADLRGHGRTAVNAAGLGFLAAQGGWRKCLDDLWLLTRRIATAHPGVPIVMLGHSMGSFLVQQFIAEHGASLAGAVLAGSNGRPPPIAAAGRLVARLERLYRGPRGRSALIHALAFGGFNDGFRPARTAFDWLSRDREEVDLYVNDPLCGFVPTVQLWIDLLDALARLNSRRLLARIPKDLPILVIAGRRDPVSANTRGLVRLLVAYRRAGLRRVRHRFYPEARHELFNETIRDEVTRDLIAWCDGVVGDGMSPRPENAGTV